MIRDNLRDMVFMHIRICQSYRLSFPAAAGGAPYGVLSGSAAKLRIQLLRSISELLSALCTATGKNLASVLSGHSLSESVLLLALELFGLIGSEHSWNPPFNDKALHHSIIS